MKILPMHKLLFTLLTLLAAQFVGAKTTIIGGHFNQPKAKTVTIQYHATVLSFIEQRTTKQEVNLDEHNNFRFELETDMPILFNLLNGEEWMFINKYIAAGDSIWIEFRENEMAFNGSCEECMAWMFEWESKYLSDPVKNKAFNSSYATTNTKEFSDFWNARRKEQLDFLKSYVQNKPLPPAFIRYMEGEINYDYGMAMLQYSWRNRAAKNILKDQEYIQFLSQIQVDNPEAIVIGRYVYFLRELPYSLFNTYVDYDNYKDPANQYALKNIEHVKDSMAKQYFTGQVYELALYHILHDNIRNLNHLKGRPSFEATYRRSDSIITLYHTKFLNQGYYERLVRKLHEVKDENKVAPDFVVKDLSGKEVKLSDFKGKAIYLDFWATTCAPCVAELPHAKKLQEKFKGKDIVFLYVSLDHSLEKVKAFVKSNAFDGIHLIDTKGFASDVANRYEINYIPHYFLIDKDGLLKNSNAPRPSGLPEEMLLELLK